MSLDGVELIAEVDPIPLPVGWVGYSGENLGSGVLLVDNIYLWGASAMTANGFDSEPSFAMTQTLSFSVPTDEKFYYVGAETNPVKYGIFEVSGGDGSTASMIPLPAEVVDTVEEYNAGGRSFPYGVTASPDGQRLAFGCSVTTVQAFSRICVIDQNGEFYVLDLPIGNPEIIYNIGGWSPDGNWLVYDTEDGIWAVDLSTPDKRNNPEPVLQANVSSRYGSTTWGPDWYIYFVDTSTPSWDIYRIPFTPPDPPTLVTTASTAGTPYISAPPDTALEYPHVNAEGQVVYTQWGDEASLIIYDPVAGSSQTIETSTGWLTDPTWSPHNDPYEIVFFTIFGSLPEGLAVIDENGTNSESLNIPYWVSTGKMAWVQTKPRCLITGLEALPESDPRCQVGKSLAEYHVVIRGIGTKNADDEYVWDIVELETILEGVRIVGDALMIFYNEVDPSVNFDSQEAFITIFGLDTAANIAFDRAIETDGCFTSGPLSPTPENDNTVLSVTCNRILPYPDAFNTVYTIVHELGGHGLIKLRNSDFRILVSNPVPGGRGLRLSDAQASFVFGPYSPILFAEPPNSTVTSFEVSQPDGTIEIRYTGPDWRRDRRGWGGGVIGTDTNPYPGPCGMPATEIPPDFQQNACNFVNYFNDLPSDAGVIEQEEAAADMSLNWVYSTSSEPGGFDAENDFGVARLKWANCAMVILANKYQWLTQSIDVTQFDDCEDYGQHLEDLIDNN